MSLVVFSLLSLLLIFLILSCCEGFQAPRLLSGVARFAMKTSRLNLAFNDIKVDAEKKMTASLQRLQEVLSTIRTTGPNMNLLDRVFVDHLGTRSRIPDICRISSPNNLLLVLEPFQQSVTLIKDIEKALMNAKMNLNPQQDSSGNIIIHLPPPSEERRKEFIKLAHGVGEEGRVSIRNSRRDAIEKIKKAEKDKDISKDESKKYQDNLQKVTDEYCKKIDKILEVKEKDLMKL